MKKEKPLQCKGEPGFTFLKHWRFDGSLEWVREGMGIELDDRGKGRRGCVAAPCADTIAVPGDDARPRPSEELLNAITAEIYGLNQLSSEQ